MPRQGTSAPGIIPAHAGSTGSCSPSKLSSTAHPRARGEHHAASLPADRYWGSSPRTRGALRPRRDDRIRGRIIPAHAGSTTCGRSTGGHARDHPRARGEHPLPQTRIRLFPGSSPRTRGARAGRRLRAGAHGIIPAHAGSTPRCCSSPPTCRDHPRARGEHQAGTPGDEFAAGSSPRTRGALAGNRTGSTGTGIIPAHAGSTATTPTISRRSWDHPRARGEHAASTSSTTEAEGSSPRTRGAHLTQPHLRAVPGIIPAHAGSTWRAPGRRERLWDHPRARGEHPETVWYPTGREGSSPRTRGAPEGVRRERDGAGIIPAHAGSTTRWWSGSPRIWDHLRARGEHLNGDDVTQILGGSSPRTRGARPCDGPGGPGRGIIPAHAGSTPSGSAVTAPGWDHPRARGEHHYARRVQDALEGSSPRTRGAR